MTKSTHNLDLCFVYSYRNIRTMLCETVVFLRVPEHNAFCCDMTLVNITRLRALTRLMGIDFITDLCKHSYS